MVCMAFFFSTREKVPASGTVRTASIFVNPQPNYVVDARRGPTAQKNVKPRTGPEKVTARDISTGVVVTSAEKRTSTGRSSPFPTKDLEAKKLIPAGFKIIVEPTFSSGNDHPGNLLSFTLFSI